MRNIEFLISSHFRSKSQFEHARLKKCNYFDELLIARYYDGEMLNNERKEFETHMSNCRYCASRYLDLKKDLLLNRVGDSAKPLPEKEPVFETCIKILQKGLEIIEKYLPSPVPQLVYAPVMRGSNKKNIKEIIFKHKFQNIPVLISFTHITKNKIDFCLKINQKKEKSLFNLYKNNKFVEATNADENNNIVFKNLTTGKYIIDYKNLPVVKFEII